uniref:WcnJ n=2 Tax=Vibrio parahaemolyticus TaxID=670 RepID=A0A7M1VUP5_VIBPH|nr:hypothetical protein VP315_00011 [Vibrio parahaemolyticus]
MSSRFFKAGYDRPKYMLEAHGKTLFEHSVESFKSYFFECQFLFIIKDQYQTKEFVEAKAKKMGIKRFYIVSLSEDTRGQGETVALGLEKFKSSTGDYDGAITIFNIDTFRPGFNFPQIINHCNGYLEVFEGDGNNWSFAEPESKNSTKVIRTAEKKAISNLCSTGLYYFDSIDLYFEAYETYKSMPKENWEKGELYIAPMYNCLIENGYDIHYDKITREDVIFCGVPDEYINFVKRK